MIDDFLNSSGFKHLHDQMQNSYKPALHHCAASQAARTSPYFGEICEHEKVST